MDNISFYGYTIRVLFFAIINNILINILKYTFLCDSLVIYYYIILEVELFGQAYEY